MTSSTQVKELPYIAMLTFHKRRDRENGHRCRSQGRLVGGNVWKFPSHCY